LRELRAAALSRKLSAGGNWSHGILVCSTVSVERTAVFIGDSSSAAPGRRQRLTGPGRAGISIGGAAEIEEKGL
jgi:hypothetical protein